MSSPLTNPTLLVYLRCTMYCATLIDNIFTELNELNNNISSGLMICDVTDHLPVFAICKHSDIKDMSTRDTLLLNKLMKIALDPSKTTYYCKTGRMLRKLMM